MDDELILTDEGIIEEDTPLETSEAVIESSNNSVLNFVTDDLPHVFLIGFTSGLLIISIVYSIRVVARLFSRIVKS